MSVPIYDGVGYVYSGGNAMVPINLGRASAMSGAGFIGALGFGIYNLGKNLVGAQSNFGFTPTTVTYKKVVDPDVGSSINIIVEDPDIGDDYSGDILEPEFGVGDEEMVTDNSNFWGPLEPNGPPGLRPPGRHYGPMPDPSQTPEKEVQHPDAEASAVKLDPKVLFYRRPYKRIRRK